MIKRRKILSDGSLVAIEYDPRDGDVRISEINLVSKFYPQALLEEIADLYQDLVTDIATETGVQIVATLEPKLSDRTILASPRLKLLES